MTEIFSTDCEMSLHTILASIAGGLVEVSLNLDNTEVLQSLFDGAGLTRLRVVSGMKNCCACCSDGTPNIGQSLPSWWRLIAAVSSKMAESGVGNRMDTFHLFSCTMVHFPYASLMSFIWATVPRKEKSTLLWIAEEKQTQLPRLGRLCVLPCVRGVSPFSLKFLCSLLPPLHHSLHLQLHFPSVSSIQSPCTCKVMYMHYSILYIPLHMYNSTSIIIVFALPCSLQYSWVYEYQHYQVQHLSPFQDRSHQSHPTQCHQCVYQEWCINPL